MPAGPEGVIATRTARRQSPAATFLATSRTPLAGGRARAQSAVVAPGYCPAPEQATRLEVLRADLLAPARRPRGQGTRRRPQSPARAGQSARPVGSAHS